MSTRGNPPSNDRSPVLPLRLLRFKHGEWADVWITHHLTDGRVMGCFTRYLGNGSVFVPSHASGEVKEGKPVIWKGYLSAVQYHRDIKKWVPVVLEVTERLEQDLRGRVARGQLWKISRGPKDGNKRIPLRGVMGQQQRPEMTPVAIDVYPKLRNDIFRNQEVTLDQENPLPDLVVVVPLELPPPGEQTEPAAPESRKRFSDFMGERNGEAIIGRVAHGIGRTVPNE